MSNHFHWLVSTPNANLASGMQYFMTQTSKAIGKSSQRINKIYGGRYKWTLVDNEKYFLNTYRYILQNPVRAGITKLVHDYPWSTCVQGKHLVDSESELLKLLPSNPELEKWLNTVPSPAYNFLMSKALRRSKFKFPDEDRNKFEISLFNI